MAIGGRDGIRYVHWKVTLGVCENVKSTKCMATKGVEKRKCDNEAKGIDGWPVVRSSTGKVI